MIRHETSSYEPARVRARWSSLPHNHPDRSMLMVNALWRQRSWINVKVFEIHELVDFQISLVWFNKRRVGMERQSDRVFAMVVHVAYAVSVI